MKLSLKYVNKNVIYNNIITNQRCWQVHMVEWSLEYLSLNYVWSQVSPLTFLYAIKVSIWVLVLKKFSYCFSVSDLRTFLPQCSHHPRIMLCFDGANWRYYLTLFQSCYYFLIYYYSGFDKAALAPSTRTLRRVIY